MLRFKTIVLLFLLSFGALASEPLRWRDHQFREVSGLAALPVAIRERLGAGIPGPRGVVDMGKPFNVTDVGDGSKPMRRLLAAGKSGDTWLVALEQGGRGYNVQVYLFSSGVQQQHWVLLSHPTTLQAVIQQLPTAGRADES